MKDASVKPKGIARLIFLAVAVGVLIYLFWPRMPGYQGNSLIYWLEQYRKGEESNGEFYSQTQAEATDALRHIGTRAAPIYLQFMAAKPSPWTLKIISNVPPKYGEKLGIPAKNDYLNKINHRRTLGSCGFQALGPAAKPYVPAIAKLLQDDDPDIRVAAVFLLGSFGPVASSALPGMIKCANDKDEVVQGFAVRALGQIQTQPEKVVPILMGVLAKERKVQLDQIVCSEAIQAIKSFGAAGRPAVPMLLNLLQDPSRDIRRSATNALRHIDPEAAAKAGIK